MGYLNIFKTSLKNFMVENYRKYYNSIVEKRGEITAIMASM